MRSNENILAELNVVFKDILENDAIEISRETTADDIEEWDSLSHIQLIVAIEKHFKIRFTTAEITSYKNVGEMADGISKKTLN